MIDKLKKLFGLKPSIADVDDGVYVTYDKDSMDNYLKQFPDIELNEVVLPVISEAMMNFKISKWHKSEGDFVKTGDVLCEVHADKAVLELETFVGGYVHFRRKPRHPINVGEVVCVISSMKLDNSFTNK